MCRELYHWGSDCVQLLGCWLYRVIVCSAGQTVRRVLVDNEFKQAGAKIIHAEEESMLKQWENMHRPPGPDHVIPPSGPGQAGILAPTHREVDRRCSVISTNQTKSTSIFPLLTTKKGDMRRPSDIWQGGA